MAKAAHEILISFAEGSVKLTTSVVGAMGPVWVPSHAQNVIAKSAEFKGDRQVKA
jgi:hypothetical protein